MPSILRLTPGHPQTTRLTLPSQSILILEHEGAPISMLLDLVEVAKSHTGVNLAEAFAKVLQDFGIEDKVSIILEDNYINLMLPCSRS